MQPSGNCINRSGIKLVTPGIDYSVRALCARPYPGHPKGCPNFGQRPTCPPMAKRFEDVYELSRPVYVIYNAFPIGEHVAIMREKHPDWSERQLRCCLYWQGRARKQLQEKIDRFIMVVHGYGWIGYAVTTCPEAMGINVTETMKRAGIELEWPPEKIVYQVAVAGVKK